MSFNYSESMLQRFKNCPRSAQFEYVLRLEKEKEDKDEHHLAYGAACHDSMEKLYTGKTLKEAKEAFTSSYPKQLDPADEGKTQANWFNLLDQYARTQFMQDMERYEVLSVESRQTMEFAGEDQFVCKLDLVMKDRRDGGIYGLDWKVTGGTKAYLSVDSFWGQFNPNSQITKYVGAIKQKYGHCSGFFIHAFGMGHRSRMYKGEPAGPWFRQQRMEFNRTPDQVNEEELDTKSWIGHVQKALEANYWPKNTSNCKFCQFKQICQAGYQVPDDMELITIMYKQRELRGN